MRLEFDKDKALAIAKKEYMDNVRNRWALGLTVLFLILTLFVSYFSVTYEVEAAIGDFTPVGDWDAMNNIPMLGDGGMYNGSVGGAGQFLFVTTPGNTSVDGNSTWLPGDWIVNDGSSWALYRTVGYWDATNNTPIYMNGTVGIPFADGGVGGNTGEVFYVVSNASNPGIDDITTANFGDLVVNTGDGWMHVKAVELEAKVEFEGFQKTVEGMSTLTSMLLPIIAIMLGYGAIIGERENGSLGVVLGCPVSRFDLMTGKFIGIGAVLATTIVVGFGIAGLIVAAFAGTAKSLEYVLFIALSLVFAWFFMGFSILFSTLARKRSTAIGSGLFLWFSGMIVGVVLIGVYAATGGDVVSLFGSYTTGGQLPTFPDWFWIGEYFNFMDIYAFGSVSIFGISQFFGIEIAAPGFVRATTIFLWFFGLTVLSYVMSLFFLNRRDI